MIIKRNLLTLLLAAATLLSMLASCDSAAPPADTEAEVSTTDVETNQILNTEIQTETEPAEPVTYEVIERNGYVNTFDITDYAPWATA